jgi:hypothetical protein
MQQGVPKSLHISDDLPPSIRAYRRQSVHLNTTQNAFGPGSIAIIPIDTGTEGVFVDTRTIRLVFDVTFKNRCRYIDFVNLGRAGAASFIEEIALEINGVPIERNTQYAATTELEKIRRGEAADPFMMTFENPFQPLGSSQFAGHINLIKPCMVDCNGVSWDNNLDESVIPSVFNHVYNASVVASHNGEDTDQTLNASGDTTNDFINAERYISDWAYGNNDSVSIWGRDKLANPKGSRTSVYAGSGAAYGPPGVIPCDILKLKEMVQAQRRGRRDLKTVYAEGANMKLIPVHHRPSNQGWTKAMHFIGWNTTSSPTECALDDFAGTDHTYQFSLELYMGVFGRMNTKWLPTLAIGAGRAQLRLKFARPQQAFDVAMDPCRRIPGTLRDTCANSYGKDSRVPTTWSQLTSSYTDIVYDPSAVQYDYLVSSKVNASGNWYEPASKARSTTITKEEGDDLLFSPLVPSLAMANGTFPSVSAFTMGGDTAVTYTTVSEFTSGAAIPHITANYLPPGVDNGTGGYTDATGTCGRFSFTAPPACQYMLSSNPNKGRNGTADDFANEASLCYGTPYPSAKAQSRRTHLGALPLGLPNVDYNNGITYEIRNLQIRAAELLFSDEITDSLLQAGIAGNAVMETVILRETKVQLHQNGTQKILIPITGASIQDLCVAFRHQEQLWGPQALSQPTYSFIDPFTAVNYTTDASFWKGVRNMSVQSAWSNSGHLGINMYFQLGSEFLPRVPIDDISGFTDFVCQGDQIFYGAGELGDYRRMNQNPERMDIFTELITSSSNSSAIKRINHFDPGFFTTFMNMEILDDQTITGNPFLYLFAPLDELPMDHIGQILPYVQPSVGTFHISLNLETMMGHGHKTRSGSTIVNNQLYLKMDRAYGCAQSPLEMIAYARCNAKVVFERGGSVQVIS